jgi:aerobic-type carbon monoxide dehydrogenase small subunit (CoxS/CutS family)
MFRKPSTRSPNKLTHDIRFKLNGRWVRVRAPPAKTLLRLLRDEFDLTGSKAGCEAGECGACTVLLDGRPVTSCMVLAAQVEAREVTTVEGLAKRGRGDPIVKALVEEGAVQCGYCIPGFLVAARGLLNEVPRPAPETVRVALSGNLCRCGGYSKIVEAVIKASSRSKPPGGLANSPLTH